MEERKLTGYPSIDKPWLKYYSEEAINAKLPECTMYEYLYENNQTHLNETALLYFDRKTTYGQLFERIGQAAKAFRRIGVRKGDIVTLCTVTTPETVYSLYALNLLGAASNMVDPRTSEEGVIQYLNETGAKTLVVISAALPKIAALLDRTRVERIIVVSPAASMPLPVKLGYRLTQGRNEPKPPKDARYIAWKDFVQAPVQDGPAASIPYAKNMPAVIVHTGGTTGMPKGVMLSNDNLNSAAYQGYACGLDYKPQDVWLDYMPPFIAYGIGNGLHLPLSAGMKVILMPRFNPAHFDSVLLKYRPNHMAGVPTHWESVLSSKKLRNKDLSFIHAPAVGGDTMNLLLEQQVNNFLEQHHVKTRIIKGYGMTETCAAVCVCSRNEINREGSVGIPFSHMTIAILNPETHEELTYHQIGEIVVSGPNCMMGYYENAAATERMFLKHNGRSWIMTGDIGYINEDGSLYIVDRMKRMIIRPDGFKLYPSVIENVVIKHPAVEACGVVGVRDRTYSQGMVPKAFLVLQKDGADRREKTLAEIAALCRKELPEYAQPACYTVLDALPLTPIGKVDYRALEQMETK